MANAVSESGLYKFIMRSDKPEAIAFQNWVTKEVLPSIRKSGGYLLNENARLTAHADNKAAHLWNGVVTPSHSCSPLASIIWLPSCATGARACHAKLFITHRQVHRYAL